MKLCDLKRGRSGIILSVDIAGNIRQRLYELGITPGAEIYNAFSSAGNNPVAYYIKGSVIALRREDAEMISITEDGINGEKTKCPYN